MSTFIPALAYTFAHHPAEVEVAHEERAAGESKYSLYKLVRLNFDLVTGFSLVPLQAFSLIGMLVSIGSLLLYAVVMVHGLLTGEFLESRELVRVTKLHRPKQRLLRAQIDIRCLIARAGPAADASGIPITC